MRVHPAIRQACYSSRQTPNAVLTGALEGTWLNAFPGIDAMTSRPALILSSGALCAVALGFALAGRQPGPEVDTTSEGRRALVQSLESRRCIEGRLTGGFRHGRIERHGGSCSAGLRLFEASKGTTPERMADQGVTELLDQRWHQAVIHLEEASARSADNPRIAADLAAAYLERSDRSSRALDNFLALVAAGRAVAIDPFLAEALFNRALAFERLGLVARARADWVRYLTLERDSGWSAEAEEHLEALEHPATTRHAVPDRKVLTALVATGDEATILQTVASWRRSSRRLGEEELLADWAHALQGGRLDEAAHSIELARVLGEALAGLSGDNLLRDTVAFIEKASADQAQTLVRGQLIYAEGSSLYGAADYRGAIIRFQAAQRVLAAAGSPFAWRAAFAAGTCEHFLSLRASARRHFAAVEAEAAAKSYRSLLGESLWMEGLGHFADRDVPRALAAYGKALEVFKAIRENENIAGVEALLAEIADYQGEVEEAWQHRLAALSAARETGDSRRLFLVYAELTMAATRQGEHQIALYFQEEVLRIARQAKNPIGIAQALFWRCRNQQQLGLVEHAVDDIRRARLVLAGARDSEIRQRTEADLSLAAAELTVERAPREALPLLSEALDLYLAGGHRAHLIDIFRVRAQAYQRLGDVAAAEKDLEAAARWIEDWRNRINASSDRISFFSKSDKLFDALALLHLEGEGDTDRAFDTLERQSARALLDSVLPNVQPLTVREIAARLPANTAIVSYAVLDGRLYAFVLDRRGVRRAEPVPEGWPSIKNGIAAFRAGLAGHAGTTELDRQSGALYAALIEPLADALPAGAKLIISGDGELQRLPFAALRNPRSGRYLVQDHVLTMAPSASVYLESARRFHQLAAEAPRRLLLLSYADPDRVLYPELRPLRGTAVEARRAAALYPDPVLREGQDARTEAFFREAPGAEIIHFVGHAIKMGAARRSCLVLAPSRDAGGLLCGEEIEHLHLSRTRLVILSGCGTADGRTASGEGIESLTRSFLAAGAPAVVGTSWNVNDRTAYLFLDDLHRGLREGMDPALALRSAQLRCLDSEDPERRSPQFWANFRLTGGTS